MSRKTSKKKIRRLKHKSIRNKIFGSTQRPRLSVYRSLKNIYAQIIDDDNEKTLVSCSTLEKDIKNKIKSGGNKEAAKIVGQEIAVKAVEKGIDKVVFDRAGLTYHGRIKELAEGAREKGLKF